MENSNEKEDMRALIMVFVIWLLLWCVDNRQYFLSICRITQIMRWWQHIKLLMVIYIMI